MIWGSTLNLPASQGRELSNKNRNVMKQETTRTMINIGWIKIHAEGMNNATQSVNI